MLRGGGVANSQKVGELADRFLTVDELAKDQKAVPIGQRFQECAGLICGDAHDFWVDLRQNIHNCEYAIY